jgi:hypothetical protein
MRAMLARIEAEGNPYGDVRPQLAHLTESQPSLSRQGGVFLCADAASLSLAPHMAQAALRLLQTLNRAPAAVAQQVYHGLELWRYGFDEPLAQIARAVVGEIEISRATTVVTLSPASADLLRRVYPRELGVPVAARVLTLAEAVDEWIQVSPIPIRRDERDTYLVVSEVDAYRLGIESLRRVMEQCGSRWVTDLGEPLTWEMVYPEGLRLDLEPDPGLAIRDGLEASIRASDAAQVVVTHAEAWHALRHVPLTARLVDWPSYLLEHLNTPPV